MATQRTILVVDPDPGTLRALGPALRRQGYRLHGAADGSRALEVAVLRAPDLVLVDEDAALVDARTFVRILRTNPRTGHIPVVLTGRADDPERARAGHYLRKPLTAEQVVARVEQVFRRLDAERAAASAEAGLEGDLAQLPLPDLLQILGVNRRSGRLELDAGPGAAVVLDGGEVVDATAGAARGEKALFRLLARRSGTFAFRPGPGGAERRIARRTEELLLEAMRQVDETARLLAILPDPATRFVLAAPSPAGRAADAPPPARDGIAALLATPSTAAELLERSAAPDVDVLRELAALLERGRAVAQPAPPETPAAAFLGEAELHRLRLRLGGARGGAPVTGKLLVAGGGPLARRSAVARWTAVGDLDVSGGGAAAFGTLGRLTIDPGVQIDLVALPAGDALRPLWRPLAAGALGVVVLLPADGLAPDVVRLARSFRLPLAVCGPSPQSVEAELRAPGVALFLGDDPAAAVRALLARGSG